MISAGESITIECNVTFNRDLTLTQAALESLCSLPGGFQGLVDVADVFVDQFHLDPPYLYAGLKVNPVTKPGPPQCFAAASLILEKNPTLKVFDGEVFYFTTFVYQASTCAEGTFTFDLACPYPNSFNYVCGFAEQGGPHPFDNDILGVDWYTFPITVIPCNPGSCCLNGSCLADGVSEAKCEDLVAGGAATFYLGRSCGDFCGCEPCKLHGDFVNPFCAIDVDDILFELAAFGDADPAANFPGSDLMPCGGNGAIDVDDILSTLRAFAGDFDCPHPCQP